MLLKDEWYSEGDCSKDHTEQEPSHSPDEQQVVRNGYSDEGR
jgi:hypothetical protein